VLASSFLHKGLQYKKINSFFIFVVFFSGLFSANIKCPSILVILVKRANYVSIFIVRRVPKLLVFDVTKFVT